jgi:hypothetical protein
MRPLSLPVASALAAPLFLAACPTLGNDLYRVRGTGRLPACTEAPAFELHDTVWYDNGELSILTEGCQGYQAGTVLRVCALQWAFTQVGRDVAIVVDHEYAIDGRLCGTDLHLDGGWWLPVTDDAGRCTYGEDYAEEVGIEAEGNVLTVAPGELTGALIVRAGCTASYDVVFHPVP